MKQSHNNLHNGVGGLAGGNSKQPARSARSRPAVCPALGSQDSAADGVVMDGEVGMALKAMEYWRCAETGLQAPPASPHQPTLKFVIAESLHGE